MKKVLNLTKKMISKKIKMNNQRLLRKIMLSKLTIQYFIKNWANIPK